MHLEKTDGATDGTRPRPERRRGQPQPAGPALAEWLVISIAAGFCYRVGTLLQAGVRWLETGR